MAFENDPLPEEFGEVIEVWGNTARVKVEGKKACAHCGVCTKVSETEMIVDARASEPVKKGDKVALIMSRGMVVKSAFIVYMVPLIMLIAGYYIGKHALNLLNVPMNSELFPALTGFLCLFLSFLGIRWYDRRKRDDAKFQVYVKKVAS